MDQHPEWSFLCEVYLMKRTFLSFVYVQAEVIYIESTWHIDVAEIVYMNLKYTHYFTTVHAPRSSKRVLLLTNPQPPKLQLRQGQVRPSQ